MDVFSKLDFEKLTKSVLDKRGSSGKAFSYGSIFGSLFFSYLCGGECLEDIERIVDIQLKDVRSRLANERMTLELSEAAKQALALDGLDPVYGARPLKRLIQRRVVDQVANLIIAGELHEGDTVLVDADENGNLVARKK